MEKVTKIQRPIALASACLSVGLLCQCGSDKRIVVSVPQQRMVLLTKEEFVTSYPVSTSKRLLKYLRSARIEFADGSGVG